MSEKQTQDFRGKMPDGFAIGPAVILVRPQLGENIGAVARAMLNCGLTDLRLVAPRDGWPNERALSSASGADYLIENARLFTTTAAAISDLNYVMATTARPRDMVTPVFTPETAVAQIFPLGGKAGLLYGCEKSGLDNEDITLADAIITVPLNPEFSSLNLAQAVLLTAYEWFKLALRESDGIVPVPDNIVEQATKENLLNLFDHLEDELDQSGFFKTQEVRPVVVQNLRAMLQKTALTPQEVRTFHGMIVALTGRKRRKKE